jgi:fatty acid desaturase
VKAVLRVSVGLVLLLAALASLLLGAALVFELPQHVGQITIDGQPFDLSDLGAGHWLVASAAVFAAMLAVLLIVPLVLLLTLLVPLLVAGAVAVPALLGVALLMALLVWPVVWVVRRIAH